MNNGNVTERPGGALVPAQPQMNFNNLTELLELCQVLAGSKMFDPNPGAIAAKILTGRELGFGPMASLVNIHFYEGKPDIGAHLRAASIVKSGRYEYRVDHCTRESCKIEFFRLRGDKWESCGPAISMTLQDAVDRGYAWSKKNGCLKDNWQSSPDDMLFARCLSKGYRRYCPDLAGGVLVYDRDELDDDGPAPAPTTPAPRGQVEDAEYATGDAPAAEAPPPNPTPVPATVQASLAPPPTTPPPRALPATPPEAGTITREEAEELTALARLHQRAVGEVNLLLRIAGAPVLTRLPPAKLPWMRLALSEWLALAAHVDRLTAMVKARGWAWEEFRAKLEARYGVSSLGHLTPSQATELEGLVKSAPQPQPAA